MKYNGLIVLLRQWSKKVENQIAKDALSDAADAVERLAGMGWVSVEENMPDANQLVLMANKRGSKYSIDKGYFDGTRWVRSGKGAFQNVTYWMTIPELPE